MTSKGIVNLCWHMVGWGMIVGGAYHISWAALVVAIGSFAVMVSVIVGLKALVR